LLCWRRPGLSRQFAGFNQRTPEVRDLRLQF
jgi:hypothetical protein